MSQDSGTMKKGFLYYLLSKMSFGSMKEHLLIRRHVRKVSYHGHWIRRTRGNIHIYVKKYKLDFEQ